MVFSSPPGILSTSAAQLFYLPGGRFVSGLTLTSSYCVSCIVIQSQVLSVYRVQLQKELVLGYVSGDGGVALER